MIGGTGWQKVKEVLGEALDRPGGERRAFVERACGSDERLRREVEVLLGEDALAGEFLARPFVTLDEEDADDPDEGRHIGAYRLLHRLGQGGMEAVYLAERTDGTGNRPVAVKLVKRGMDSEEILRRFRAEQHILARLDHPHIARLLGGGTTDDGRPYFAIEHVQGLPLDRYCSEYRLSIRRRLELFRRVCSAVHFAHRNRVVHRDLKPSNILVTASGDPKLLDFGIARLLGGGPDSSAGATSPDSRPMTPHYASPEQIRGGTITPAVDVYALGVMLYELLTGCSPHRFAGGSLRKAQLMGETRPLRPSRAVRRRVSADMPDRTGPRAATRAPSWGPVEEPRVLARCLAGDLDRLVLKALHRRPERRFPSVEELSEELRRYLEGPPLRSRPRTLVGQPGRWLRRHLWRAATSPGRTRLPGLL